MNSYPILILPLTIRLDVLWAHRAQLKVAQPSPVRHGRLEHDHVKIHFMVSFWRHFFTHETSCRCWQAGVVVAAEAEG